MTIEETHKKGVRSPGHTRLFAHVVYRTSLEYVRYLRYVYHRNFRTHWAGTNLGIYCNIYVGLVIDTESLYVDPARLIRVRVSWLSLSSGH